MSDLGHKLTEKELDELIKRIQGTYTEAYGEAVERASKYWNQFAKREEKMLEKLKKGIITEEQFIGWRYAQVGRGLNLNAISDNIMDVLSNAHNASAMAINDSIAGIYSMNANYTAYMIEQYSDAVSFSLLDENTVKRLVKDNPDLMPYYPKSKAIERGFDLEYGKSKILAGVRSGILQGLSIPQISKKIQESIVGMEQASAIRAARTAVTGAQNAGRQASYQRATEMGLSLRKEWIATLDSRTRKTHQHLDGERVPYNKPFSNGLMFPADPDGESASEIYNCRCTMIAVLPETEKDTRETYEEWENRKKAEEQTAEQSSEEINLEGKLEKIRAVLSEEDYNGLLEELQKNPDVANLFAKYGDLPNKVSAGTRCHVDWSDKSVVIRINNETGRNKYETISHEFGHWFDHNLASVDNLSYNIIDKINGNIGISFDSWDLQHRASFSDTFLKACLKDAGELSVSKINSILDSIAGMPDKINATGGVQDAFDGFFGVFRWWGHGDKYYNRYWDTWFAPKYHGSDSKVRKTELKSIMKEFGIPCKTDAEAKRFFRIFDASSELWANIQSAEVNGGIGQEWMKQYFPSAYDEYLKIIGGKYGAV